MKRFLGFVLIIALACSVFGLGTVTAAADTNVDFKISLDKNEAAEGGTVEATIVVKNNYADPITNVQVVYSNNGSTVFSGVSIDPGLSYGVQRDYTVGFPSGSSTVAMSYVLTYTDPNGATQTQTAATQVSESSVVKVTGSASADQKTVNAGDKVEFTFNFKNEGNVTVENATLTASPIDGGDTIGQAFSLSPGSSKEMTYTTKVNKSIDVKPKLTFTAGGENKTLELDTLSITVNEPANAGISLTLAADKTSISEGGEAVLTATIANTGDVTLTGISLTDESGQTIQTDAAALGAGESTKATVTVTPAATQNYQYSVSAKDPDGGAVQATSNQVTVTVEGAEPTPSASASGQPSGSTLAIVVDADAYTLSEAGEVNFQVTITNNSDVLLSNVTVSEETLGEIGSVSSMGKDSKTFDKTAEVSETTAYTFKVTATQEDGTEVTAVTDPLTVTVEGSSGPGLGFLGILLIIIVVAIAGVAIALFLMNRKNKKSGGGGIFGGKSGGKGPYNGGTNGGRKPSAFNSNSSARSAKKDVQPVRTTRKPAPSSRQTSTKGTTKFGDRNKF